MGRDYERLFFLLFFFFFATKHFEKPCLHLIQRTRTVLIRMFCSEGETWLLPPRSYQRAANLWLEFISNSALYASIKVRKNAGKAPV